LLVLDLKTLIFVALLLPTVLIVLAQWKPWSRVRRPSFAHGAIGPVYDALPFGVVVTGADGDPLLSNTAARRLLSIADEALLTDAALRRFSEPAQNDTARTGLLMSQPTPLRWWRYPLDDVGTLLVLADESDQQRFVQQQRAFIGQLSHELRTPLTSLAAHTEIVRSPKTSEAIRDSSLETIERETKRMARLVRDLLELHRLETSADLSLQPTNLALVAEEAVAEIILQAEQRGLCVEYNAATPLPTVPAQPDRLKQVFLNLLDNAVKYCRPGDTIRVRLEAQPKGVRCVVQDTGPGIPAADLPHVTERLYRGRTGVEGNGIGLALVSEIVRRHHATLLIESATEGETGTQVSWTLHAVA
jgi:signal transduction histidine kinase